MNIEFHFIHSKAYLPPEGLPVLFWSEKSKGWFIGSVMNQTDGSMVKGYIGSRRLQFKYTDIDVTVWVNLPDGTAVFEQALATRNEKSKADGLPAMLTFTIDNVIQQLEQS